MMKTEWGQRLAASLGWGQTLLVQGLPWAWGFGVGSVLAVLASPTLTPHLWAALLGFALVGLALWGWRPPAQRVVQAFGFLVALVVGLCYSHWRLGTLQTQLALPAHWQQAHVQVRGTLWPTERTWALATTQWCYHNQCFSAPTPLQLELKESPHSPPKASPLQPRHIGQQLTLAGTLLLPQAPLWPGAFNETTFTLAQHQVGKLVGWRLLQGPTPVPSTPTTLSWHTQAWAALLQTLAIFRLQVASTFTEALGPHAGALLGGMVLGDRAVPLPDDLRNAFTQTGQVHLVAASGMNIAIVAGALGALGTLLVWGLAPLLRWLLPVAWATPLALPLARGVQLLGMAAGVAFYALLTGLPPSIRRASTLWFLGLGVKGCCWQLPPLALLVWAVALLVLWDPSQWYSLGFQLSVLTTLGIVAYLPAVETTLHQRGIHPLFTWLFGVTFCAQLWASPLIAHHFGTFPWLSLPLNALSGVLVVPITLLGFGATLLLPALPLLSHGLLWLAQPLVHGLMALTYGGAGVPHQLWAFPHWGAIPTWWAYVLLAFPLVRSVWPSALGPQAKRLAGGAVLVVIVALVLSLRGLPWQQQPATLATWGWPSRWPKQPPQQVWVVRSSQQQQEAAASVWFSQWPKPWQLRDVAAYVHHEGLPALRWVGVVHPPKRTRAPLPEGLEVRLKPVPPAVGQQAMALAQWSAEDTPAAQQRLKSAQAFHEW
jgi:ComEC/Rec2-related protein